MGPLISTVSIMLTSVSYMLTGTALSSTHAVLCDRERQLYEVRLILCFCLSVCSVHSYRKWTGGVFQRFQTDESDTLSR